mgnify:CR=1 FL=1
MNGKMLARLAAIVFVAVALTATAIEMTREDDAPAAAPSIKADTDTRPLRTELTRCQQLGEAASSDQSCLRAWAENRRRFLGIDAELADRPSGALVPHVTEAR